MIPSTLKIQKGIPIPKKHCNRTSKWSYIVDKWEVGDSVQIPEKQRMSLAVPVSRRKQRMTARKIAPGIIRIWRIA